MSRVLRAAVAALVLVLLVPTAAVAEGWAASDPAGDVAGSTWTSEPEPCGTDTEIDASAHTNNDITRLSVRHTRDSVVITTGFRALEKSSEQFEFLYLRTNLGGWWLAADRFRTRRGFGTWASLMVEPDLPDPEEVENECGAVFIGLEGRRCRIGRDFDFRRDRVAITVPRTCLGGPRWVRVGASAYDFIDSEDPESPEETSFSDSWDGGTDLSPWAPPYGPRVHAARGARLATVDAHVPSIGARLRVLVDRNGIIARG